MSTTDQAQSTGGGAGAVPIVPTHRPQIDPQALPCPFCGDPAETELWHGGAPTKVFVGCSSDECDVRPSVCGETHEEGLATWNKRAAPPTPVHVGALVPREVQEAARTLKLPDNAELNIYTSPILNGKTSVLGWVFSDTEEGSRSMSAMLTLVRYALAQIAAPPAPVPATAAPGPVGLVEAVRLSAKLRKLYDATCASAPWPRGSTPIADFEDAAVGFVRAALAQPSAPAPVVGEIEGLVERYGIACEAWGRQITGEAPPELDASRTALLAAIARLRADRDAALAARPGASTVEDAILPSAEVIAEALWHHDEAGRVAWSAFVESSYSGDQRRVAAYRARAATIARLTAQTAAPSPDPGAEGDGMGGGVPEELTDAARDWIVDRDPKDTAEKRLFIALFDAYPDDFGGRETCPCGCLICDECPSAEQIKAQVDRWRREINTTSARPDTTRQTESDRTQARASTDGGE